MAGGRASERADVTANTHPCNVIMQDETTVPARIGVGSGEAVAFTTTAPVTAVAGATSARNECDNDELRQKDTS